MIILPDEIDSYLVVLLARLKPEKADSFFSLKELLDYLHYPTEVDDLIEISRHLFVNEYCRTEKIYFDVYCQLTHRGFSEAMKTEVEILNYVDELLKEKINKPLPITLNEAIQRQQIIIAESLKDIEDNFTVLRKRKLFRAFKSELKKPHPDTNKLMNWLDEVRTQSLPNPMLYKLKLALSEVTF